MTESKHFKQQLTHIIEKKNSLVMAVDRQHRENIDDYPEFHYG